MVVQPSNEKEKETRLTIYLPHEIFENAQVYAREHDTTISRLVTEYFLGLTTEEELHGQPSTVTRLTGTLSANVSSDDYKKHLEDKYG